MPLDSDLDIAGDAQLTVALRADRPVAQIAARLVDVAPCGSATRVSYGLLNLTHRNGHEHPEPLKPGETCTVEVPFKHVAQTFRAGHRIRLSISSSYFPIAWPAPEPVTLEILAGRSELDLPVRGPDGVAIRDLGMPRAASPLDVTFAEHARTEWSVTEDRDTGRVTVETRDHEGGAHINSYQPALILTHGP